MKIVKEIEKYDTARKKLRGKFLDRMVSLIDTEKANINRSRDTISELQKGIQDSQALVDTAQTAMKDS